MTEHLVDKVVDEEVAVMQRLVDELEALDQKVRERVVTYLYDRYGTHTPWP